MSEQTQTQTPKVVLQTEYSKFEAIGYNNHRGRFRPTALEGKELLVIRLFEIANELVGADDEITSITIRGKDLWGRYYQVTIKEVD